MKTNIIFVGIFILFSLSVFGQNITSGLVAYYPFNGNANDESGNGINPTYIGTGVTLTNDRFGNPDKAYYFDGNVGSYIKMPADRMPTTNRTISLWFNVPDVTNRPGLLGYGGDGSCGTTLFMGLNCSGSPKFWVHGHCGYNRTGYSYTTDPINNWYHFVLTINDSTQKIYVNGVLKSIDNSFSGSTVVSGKDLALGVITSTFGIAPYTDMNIDYLKGTLDDVRIYDAVLTEEQVQQLYQTESSGLIAYYPFNGNANDESGNGHYGIINGNVTLTSDRFLSEDKAFTFPDQSSSISLANSTDLNLESGFSINAWIKYKNAHAVIVCKHVCGFTNGFFFGIDTDGQIQLWLGNSVWSTVRTNRTYIEDQWYMVSTTFDANTGIAKVFVNGELDGTGSVTYNNFSSNPISIGETFQNNCQPANMSGAVDEVKIYDRPLSNEEINQEYNLTRNSLVAFFPFNGNANDSTGNNHNGVVSGASLTTDRFGNSNSAYSFNGMSDYIEITSANTLRLPEYTYEAWIYPTANPTGGILAKGAATILDIGGEIGDQVLTIGNYIDVYIGISGFGYYLGGGTYNTQTGFLPALNQWYQVVATRSSTEYKLFINGELIQRVSLLPIAPDYDVSTLALIGKRIGDLQYFEGKIDDIGIYNVALTDSQVQEIYKKETLVAYYPFSSNIIISPNPTDGHFVIDLGSTYQNIKINISDITGQTIKEVKYSNVQKLNQKIEAPSGIYFINIITEKEKATCKLIKK